MRRCLAAVLLVAAGCTASGADRGPGRAEPLGGDVTVDGRRLEAEAALGAGAILRTGEDGRAVLRLGARIIELGPETEVRVDAAAPSLERGTVLLGGGAGIRVAEGGITSSGDVRVDRLLAVRIGAYEGTAGFSATRATVAVERFREASVAPGLVPRTTRPLRVESGDVWDRRFLAPELELDRSASAVAAGLVSPAAAEAALRALDAPGARSVSLPAADLVVAAAIASASPGLRLETVPRAVGLREQGASWAVLAATLGADPDLALVELERASEGAAAAEAGPDEAPASPGPRPAPSPEPSPEPGATPSPPAPSPSPGPPPDPCPGCGPVERLLCDIAGVCTNLPVLP